MPSEEIIPNIQSPAPVLRGQMQITAMLDDVGFDDQAAADEIHQLSERMENVRESITSSANFSLHTISSDASISFEIQGKEYLKLSPKGFFVNNRQMVDDGEIYKAFIDWMNDIRILNGQEPKKFKEPEPKGKPSFNRYTALTKKRST